MLFRSLQPPQMRFHGPSDRNEAPQDRQARGAYFTIRSCRYASALKRDRSAALRRFTILLQSTEQYFLRPGGTGLLQPSRWQIIS